MSVAEEPDEPSASILLVLRGKSRDLGGFTVRRTLPSMRRRLVGPFIFFDEMGPARLPIGAGMDVRPHPHIGLATVTYLFDGEIDHRDTLGTFQTIRPGDVNWMVAGAGIAHSERSGPVSRREGVHIHGIQCWVALPREGEERAPSFEHHPSATIPHLAPDGVELQVVAGEAYGLRSPVGVTSPTLYVHARFSKGARLAVDATHRERAVYVVDGSLTCDERTIEAGTMIVLPPDADVSVSAREPSRVMLLGGAPLDGERFIDWNFVSSSKERIERAKVDWESGRFGKVAGDAVEFIPYPRPSPAR